MPFDSWEDPVIGIATVALIGLVIAMIAWWV